MNAAAVTEARTWLGVRWLHQGRTREGIDCAGLGILVAQQAAGIDFDKTDYPRQATDETMIELCERFMDRVSPADMAPGDIAIFAFANQRHMAVVGDYVFGGLSLIHAYAPARKVVETRFDEVWRGRLRRAFRFREVA